MVQACGQAWYRKGDAGLDKRFLTFFVLTSDASKARQFKATVKRLKIAGVVAAVLALTFAVILVDYSRLKYNTSELHGLRKENAAQKIILQDLSAKTGELETRLANLSIFDRKLRILANIENPRNQAAGHQDQVMGIGGASSDDDSNVSSTGAKTAELVNRMRSDLKELDNRARHQEKSFTELQGELVNKSSMLASTPSILPVRGWITSGFGERTSPFTGFTQMHNGLDIANEPGTAVVATANGIVAQAGREDELGKMVVISHGYGLKTTFGHLSEISVRIGQRVRRGDKIGAIGSTGRSTGPHLHYQVSANGVTVNPVKYILN